MSLMTLNLYFLCTSKVIPIPTPLTRCSFQARHPRGVLIEDPVSKAQWIFDQRLRR